MGIIKFEVDIPNFEKELSISITIRRDGEVFYSTSSPSVGNTNLDNSEFSHPNDSFEKLDVDIQEPKQKLERGKKTEEPINSDSSITSPKKPKGGNFMNMDF